MNRNPYSLTKWEQETVINYNEDEKQASIFTHSKSLIKKLDSLCKKFPELYVLEKEDKQWQSKTYILLKKYIAIKAPKKLSKEQIQKQKERMLKVNESNFKIKN